MKKILFTIMLGLMSMITNAQDTLQIDENGGFSQVVETNLTAKQEYAYARDYWVARINNYQKAVQVEDAENGKLVIGINRRFLTTSDKLMKKPIDYDGIEKFNITIDCKDKRFRIRVDAVRYTYDNFMTMTSNGGNVQQRMKVFSRDNEEYRLILAQMTDAKAFKSERQEYFSKLIADLKSFMEKQAKDDDF